MRKYHIVINRLKVNTNKEVSAYASEMMQHPYSEDEGWGYSDVQRVDKTVYAILQKRVATYYSVWNEVIQKVERQCFQIVTETPFEIDFQQGLLIAEGTNTQLNRVKQSFRQVFWNEFVYEDLMFLPFDYIRILKESNMLASVDEMTIKDFQYEGCLLGRYTAKLTSQYDFLSKICDHAKNIIRVKLEVNVNDEKANLTVNNRSMLVLDSSEDAKNLFMCYLKSILK